MSLTQLALATGISKSYIWNLEQSSTTTRPSAETVATLADALGVTIGDLLGRPAGDAADDGVPVELEALAKERQLPEADVAMLASISFRGRKPRTKERWEYIYNAIRTSAAIDPPVKGNRLSAEKERMKAVSHRAPKGTNRSKEARGG